MFQEVKGSRELGDLREKRTQLGLFVFTTGGRNLDRYATPVLHTQGGFRT